MTLLAPQPNQVQLLHHHTRSSAIVDWPYLRGHISIHFSRIQIAKVTNKPLQKNNLPQLPKHCNDGCGRVVPQHASRGKTCSCMRKGSPNGFLPHALQLRPRALRSFEHLWRQPGCNAGNHRERPLPQITWVTRNWTERYIAVIVGSPASNGLGSFHSSTANESRASQHRQGWPTYCVANPFPKPPKPNTNTQHA